MNKQQLIQNATTNNLYMKKLTYQELCRGLKIEPKRGGYRQNQLRGLQKIFNIYEYKTAPTTYRITKPKPHSEQFCVDSGYEHCSGIYVIECDGYKDFYGETTDYLKRYNELKRDKRSIAYEMLKNGGKFYNCD